MLKPLCSLKVERCLGWLCLFALVPAVVLLLTTSPKAAEGQAKKYRTLEEEMVSQAPAIVDFLWKKMKHPESSLHVGVIKFLVQIGDNRPSDNAGPLNWYIARRLEAALILTLPDDKADTIRILHIHNPSKEIMSSANHLTEDGRSDFFRKKITPAWGDQEKIFADMFLTGLVKIVDGGRNMEVVVQAFDRTDRKLVEVYNCKVVSEAHLLTEAGVSFGLSRGTDEGREKWLAAWNKPELPPEEIVVASDKPKPGQGVKPISRPTVRQLLEQAPIEFQVYYKDDEKTRKVEMDEDGILPEPPAGTKVSFRLKHKNNQDKHTYGVVLKINGENSIYREETEPYDFRAHQWILEPKDDYYVPGFLQRNLKDKVAAFTALPVSESKLEEVNYGPHAGTFTLVIFMGQKEGKAQPEEQESEVVLNAARRGVPVNLGNPNSLKALKNHLQQQAAQKHNPTNGRPRGIIVPGEPLKQPVDTLKFQAYPTPVSVIQLRYYKPHSRE
jgi:hypothetical protein